MPDKPDGMLQRDRQADQNFDSDEQLYRAFHPDALDGDEIALDSVELPDISTLRSKFAQPQWARTVKSDWTGWGVWGIFIAKLPVELMSNGVSLCEIKVHHTPQRQNYPHTDVQAHREGRHLKDASEISEEMSLLIRYRLASGLKIRVRPE